MKNNKLNKNHIIAISCLLTIAVIVIIVIAITKSDGAEYLNAVEYTAEEIAEKSREAVDGYEYALLVLDQEISKSGEIVGIEEYILSSERDGTKRTYTYVNSDSSILSEWWDAIEQEDGSVLYDTYIYSEQYETWIHTELSEEPINNDIWRMFDIMSQYTVLPETGEWFDTGDECYVLQLIGSSDGYYDIYEEIYVRCSDFIPMGIVEYCVDTEENDRVDEINPEDYDFELGDGYTITDGEITSEDYNELLRKYSISFSHDDCQLFEKPETYISDEDYMYLLYTYEDDEETDDTEEVDSEEEEESDGEEQSE